jgi:hypothetical protein
MRFVKIWLSRLLKAKKQKKKSLIFSSMGKKQAANQIAQIDAMLYAIKRLRAYIITIIMAAIQK